VAETSRDELVKELERRIDELETLDEEAFGQFTPLDWVICVIGAIALPYLALIWFGG
jgi:hypothetical protein